MAGQTGRDTRPITSSDTIALITNMVIPQLEEIKGDIKVINSCIGNVEEKLDSVDDAIKQFRITLYGNGDAEKPGLVGIVSGLSSWIKKRSKIELAVIIGAVLAVLGEVSGFVIIIIRLQAIH